MLSSEPLCLATDSSTNTYVGTQEGILVYPAGSTNAAAWAKPTDDVRLTSLSVGPTGLFAADYGGRCVWQFNLSGRLLGRLGWREDAGKGPRFIVPTPHFDVVAGRNSVWVSNPGQRRIQEYSFDGIFKREWGEGSQRIDAFCGRSNPGHFAILRDGRFVTSEKGLRRVKVYDAGGRFLGLVAPDGAFGRGSAGPPVAADCEGNVLILDPETREVTVFQDRSDSR